jgi:hypothetical protein
MTCKKLHLEVMQNGTVATAHAPQPKGFVTFQLSATQAFNRANLGRQFVLPIRGLAFITSHFFGFMATCTGFGLKFKEGRMCEFWVPRHGYDESLVTCRGDVFASNVWHVQTGMPSIRHVQ